jgi:iron complex outermembrane receptor protein
MMASPSGAQDATRTSVAATQAFAIPSQPLNGAIDTFIRATGWQVGYSSAIAARVVAPAVVGTMTPEQALRRLLRTSGLTVRMTGPTTATIVSASAQATPGEGAVPGSILLDTISVTGEKVEREYFRTYTSIGVVTGQEIVDLNVPDLKSSFDLLGNVRSAPANRGNNGFVIRGLNSEGVTQPTNSAPIISVVIDGAIQNGESTRRGSRGVWDVDQIEVLRGPQSTLQGRNSLGGAVLINTKDPTWTPEFIVDGQLGTNDWRSSAFVASGPIIPNEVAIRIAGQTFRETKDITYTDPSSALLGRDEFDQIRAKALFTPSWLPGFTALFTISRTHDKPGVNAVTGPNFFARVFVATGTTVEFRDTSVDNHVADLSYDLAPGWTLKSLTSFVSTDAKISTPAGAAFDRDELRAGSDFAQDVRLVFDPPGSPLSGVVGVFAGRFANTTDSKIIFSGNILQDATFTNATQSIAAYADLRYRFLERWSLIAGGRLLQDKVHNKMTGASFFAAPEDVSTTNSVFLPKAGLAYDITPDQTVAGTVNRGYRSGFAEFPVGATTVNQVAPEFLWSYELAYRSRWFDNRLQVNANIFYYDYSNQQIVVDNPLSPIPNSTFTQNAGKSHVYGGEIEARARIFDGFSLFTSIGLLKTQFDEAVVAEFGTLNGKKFPESPTVTASFGGIYKHHTGLFAAGDISYTNGYYSAGNVANDPRRFIGSFTLVNARVGYEHKYGTISVFVRNLFDERYLTSISQGYNEATIGDGRMIGIRATGRL